MSSKQTALITGATSGIGKACALLLANNGYSLVITGRRKERLQNLKEQIELETGVKVSMLHFDVRNLHDCEKALAQLPPQTFESIKVLINNAGLAAGKEQVHEAILSDWDQMIDTNIKGLLYMTRLLVPQLQKQNDAHIINIGSLAGYEVYPGGAVYCATKHAVRAFTKGLRKDLLEFGIKVSSVNPGLAETEFSLVRFKQDAAKAKKVYEGYTPLYAEDIAEAVWFCLSRPQHVNIEEILIQCTAQADSRLVKKS